MNFKSVLLQLASDSPLSSCLSLRKTGITDMSHHAQPFFFFPHFNTVFRWSLVSQFSFMCSISHMFLEVVLQQSCPVLSCPSLELPGPHWVRGVPWHPPQTVQQGPQSLPTLRCVSLCTLPRPEAFLSLCSHPEPAVCLSGLLTCQWQMASLFS